MQAPHEIVNRADTGERGQTMVEYAVILGVITLAIVTSYGLLSSAIQGFLADVAGLFS